MRIYQVLSLTGVMIFLSCSVSTCRTVSVTERKNLPPTSTISAMRTLLTSQLSESEDKDKANTEWQIPKRPKPTVTLKRGEAEILVGLLDDFKRVTAEEAEVEIKNVDTPFLHVTKIALAIASTVGILLCVSYILKRTVLRKF